MNRGILGIGVCTLDILTQVTSFPDKESVEEAESSQLMGGGPVPTALAFAAKLGSPVSMMDTLGDDWQSKTIIDELKKLEVNCDAISVEAGAKASLASVLIRKSDGARAIRFVRSTSKPISKDQITEELISGYRIIHCNGRHLDACLKAGSICQSLNNETLLSFDGGAGRYRSELTPLLEMVNIGIVAKDFALRLTSQNEINSKLWDSLNDHFPRATLLGITDGIRGSWIQEEKGAIFHQPAYLINSVLDTTGCGDAYHGAFLSGILKNMTTQECAKTASAAGALNSIKIGGRGNLCDANEIETFLKSAQEI